MRTTITGLRGALTVVCLLPACGVAGGGPPPARVQEVRDTYFGTVVVDPYRWMEAPGNAEFTAWLKAQSEYTRRTLDSPPAAKLRQEFLARIQQLQKGASAIKYPSREGGRYFYLETPADRDSVRLMTKDVKSGAARMLVDAATLSVKGARGSIDTYAASPDGSFVAYSVSQSGSEDWVLQVVETATGKRMDVVTGAISPAASWAADASGFYYTRKPGAAGAPLTARFDNLHIYFHKLGARAAEDRPVFGPGMDPTVKMAVEAGFPSMQATRDGRFLIAGHSRGTDQFSAQWVKDLRKGGGWRKVAAYEDQISDLLIDGDWAYAVTQKNKPNGHIVRFDINRETMAQAREWLPQHPEILLGPGNGDVYAAKDALYVTGQSSGQATLRRFGRDGRKAEDIALPVTGSLMTMIADEQTPGILIGLEAPNRSGQLFAYDPASGRFGNARLLPADPADFSNIVTRRVEVPSSGGVRVPVTITARKDLKMDGRNPVLMVAYGSYGSPVSLKFTATELAWYERGGVIALVHARGGGEKGAAWHEAGRRTNKQRTVDDVIAAGEWLIAQRWTSPPHLAISGTSAGGIPAGASITQRPDLFGAALIRVGVCDLLRIETTGGGPANIMEYGTVKNAAEFRALNALSPYGRVRQGVAYPAVMFETGVNDPRVPPWQLAKMAARLQAATKSDKPILMRVDYEAGHSLGSDKSQIAAMRADEYAFLGWQLGLGAGR